jgi:hypothetical protein
MAETIAREAWILSRVRDGRPEHLGIFRSKEVAEENVAVLRGQGWRAVGPVLLLGWGFIEESGRLLNPGPSCVSHEVH